MTAPFSLCRLYVLHVHAGVFRRSSGSVPHLQNMHLGIIKGSKFSTGVQGLWICSD